MKQECRLGSILDHMGATLFMDEYQWAYCVLEFSLLLNSHCHRYYIIIYHGHLLSILIQDKDPDNRLKWEMDKSHSVAPRQPPLYSSSLPLSQT